MRRVTVEYLVPGESKVTVEQHDAAKVELEHGSAIISKPDGTVLTISAPFVRVTYDPPPQLPAPPRPDWDPSA